MALAHSTLGVVCRQAARNYNRVADSYSACRTIADILTGAHSHCDRGAIPDDLGCCSGYPVHGRYYDQLMPIQ